MHATNVRPGFTTFVACWSNPTSDSIFRLVAFFFWSHDETNVRMHWILASGRHASICQVSNVIPKKVSESDGPSTFSNARGMPSSELTCLTVDMLSWHLGDCGGPIRRKSSR